MKNILSLKKLIICVAFGALSILSILFLPSKIVSAQSQIAITFDVDLPRLQKYMPSNVIQGISNEVKYFDEGDDVEFPQFSSAIMSYYTYSWQINGVDIDEKNYKATDNCTICIKWKPISFDIYYNFVTTNEKQEITNLRLIDNYSVEKQVVYYKPNRPYYRFVDWYSSPQFLADEIEIYTDKYARGDKYIYAKWQPIVYSINYNTDATNLDNPTMYTYETPTFILSEPHKTGHIFEGWYLDKECTNCITSINKGSNGNLNLYPKWQLEKEKVTYVLPNGESEEVIVEFGKDAPRPNVKTNIFTVLSYDKSTQNITEDTTIVVKKVSIWYVYLIAIVLIVAIVAIVIWVKKNNEKKMHKLRLVYQSNLNKNKRKTKWTINQKK